MTSLKTIRTTTLAAKQARKVRQRLAFLPVSKARTNRFYIYRCIDLCYTGQESDFDSVFKISNKNCRVDTENLGFVGLT